MRRFTIPLITFSAALAAQDPVAIRVVADTQMTVRAGSNSRTVPSGVQLPAGWSITASDSSYPCSASAGSAIQIGPYAVRFSNGAHGGTPFLTPCGISSYAGRHAIVAHFTPPAPGWVELYAAVYNVGSGLHTSPDFSVDVGADGSAELSGTNGSYGLRHVVFVDASGIDVRVEVYRSWVNAWASCSVTQTIEVGCLTAGFGRLAPVGDACGGTSLIATDTYGPQLPEIIELTARSPLVVAPAFMTFGLSDPNTPIPPLGCILHTDILVPIPVVPDPTGTVRTRFTVPQVPLRMDFRVQYLVADTSGPNPIWRMSNAVVYDRY